MRTWRLPALAMATAVLVACNTPQPLITDGEAVGGGHGAINLEQGWSRDVQERAWFSSFGSRLLPTAWLKVLEQADAQDRFMADAHLDALGVPGKDNQLLLVEHAGTAREHRRLLESGLWYSEFDAAARRLYYSRNAHYGIFARTLSASGELSAETAIAPDIMDGWHVVGGRIWHFAPSRIVSPSADLLEFNPQDGSERLLAHMDAEPRDALFSVTPQHDRVLYTTAVSEDTDIGALRLARAH